MKIYQNLQNVAETGIREIYSFKCLYKRGRETTIKQIG